MKLSEEKINCKQVKGFRIHPVYIHLIFNSCAFKMAIVRHIYWMGRARIKHLPTAQSLISFPVAGGSLRDHILVTTLTTLSGMFG